MQTAVALLVSALQLLTLAQNNPKLPQSFRDNAKVVAQHAISFAQAEIAKNQQVAAQSTVTPVPVVANESKTAVITNADARIIDPNTAVVTWDTSVPTEGKVFIDARVVESESKVSTHHIVWLRGLVAGMEHPYIIESVGAGSSVKSYGTITLASLKKIDVYLNDALSVGQRTFKAGSRLYFKVNVQDDAGQAVAVSVLVTSTIPELSKSMTIISSQTSEDYQIIPMHPGDYVLAFRQDGLDLSKSVPIKIVQ